MKKPSKLDSLRGQPTGIQRQLNRRAEVHKFNNDRAVFGTELIEKRHGGTLRHIPLGSEEAATILAGLSKPAAAVKKSRAKNPEAYRAYQREYMRKWRAKQKP
jgi:hypothetical protein